MAQIHECKDNSDSVALHPVMGFYLKPIARMNISIHYPLLKQSLPSGGKSVSSWELMEKIKALTTPHYFISLRIVNNTMEFIRFEGDVENRGVLKTLISRLEGKSIKLTGFKEPWRVRAAEAKVQFPSKYDWDSFFRDAKYMNEMKPGERPDTIHFQNVPCKWFSETKVDEKGKAIPSEKLFRRVWETFGEVRFVDIPALDPVRHKMTPSISGIKTFNTFSSDAVFDAFVQFKDYMTFVRAMDGLRGSHLLVQRNTQFWIANIKVDFDKTKHMSDEFIRRRKIEREHLLRKEREREFAAIKLAGIESPVLDVKEAPRFVPMSSNPTEETEEEKAGRMEKKIAEEEKKYVIARRKLEAIRLIDFLFEQVKRKYDALAEKEEDDPTDEKFTEVMGRYKEMHEVRMEKQEEKLCLVLGGTRKTSRNSNALIKKSKANHSFIPNNESYEMPLRVPRSYSPPPILHSRPHHRSNSRSKSKSKSRSRSGSQHHSKSNSRLRPHSRHYSRSFSRSPHRSKSRSHSRTQHRRSRSKSKSRSRSRSHSHSHYRSKSRSRSRSHHRSKSRSDSRFQQRSRSNSRSHRHHSRSNSRSHQFSRSHSRGRSSSRLQTGQVSRSRPRSRSYSRSRSHSRSRSYSRSHSLSYHEFQSGSHSYHEFQSGSHSYPHHRIRPAAGERVYPPELSEGNSRDSTFLNDDIKRLRTGYSRLHEPNLVHRSYPPTRYLHDWEIRGPKPKNYSKPLLHHEPWELVYDHDHGIGGHNHEVYSDRDPRHNPSFSRHHQPSYLEELDHAYEKYFKSIALRNNEQEKNLNEPIPMSKRAERVIENEILDDELLNPVFNDEEEQMAGNYQSEDEDSSTITPAPELSPLPIPRKKKSRSSGRVVRVVKVR